MNILFIGGTRFLGRAMAAFAIERGHSVTLFNRGTFDPRGVPGAVSIAGDRETDLGRLGGGRWDAVVDTCGYLPRIVRQSVMALAGRAAHYTFISSISVFDHTLPEGAHENSPIKTVDDDLAGEFSMEHYGALKARCEQVVRDGFGNRALVIRPGLIVGPGDYSDRFTYWVARMGRGGPIAAPDRREMPVQWIDVRDLGEFVIRSIESGVGGDFNVTGPEAPVPIANVLARVADALGARNEFVWLDRALLERESVEPWSDLPLVLPYDGSEDGMARTNVSKAIARGLRYRTLEQTALDVRDWWNALEPPRDLKTGLSPEREARLLEAAVSR
jgi:2'-hydroxyisoflavone reductase